MSAFTDAVSEKAEIGCSVFKQEAFQFICASQVSHAGPGKYSLLVAVILRSA